jgi:hypothetical protein
MKQENLQIPRFAGFTTNFFRVFEKIKKEVFLLLPFYW